MNDSSAPKKSTFVDPKRMRTMKYRYLILLPLFAGLLLLSSCKKEDVFTYEVNDVSVNQPGAVKPNVKSDLEVISIAHTDLFGATISPSDLQELALSYQAFGDKRLMIDMIILNFLNEPNIQVPTATDMRADVEGFVSASYRKFFVREPTAFEQWFVSDLIRKDADLSPELVYYGFMTSNEYRYY
jgi:hypothetical protein